MRPPTLLTSLLLLSLLVSWSKCEPCLDPHQLRLAHVGATCYANSVVSGFECQLALDGVDATMWHPNMHEARYTSPFLSLEFKENVVVSRVDILQYKWAHGVAQRIRLKFGHEIQQSFVLSESVVDEWSEMSLPHQVTTSSIKIIVESVRGLYFGGIREVRIFGCQNQRGYWLTPNVASKPRTSYKETESVSFDYMEEEESGDLMLNETAGYASLAGVAFGGLIAVLVFFAFIYALIATKCAKSSKSSSRSRSPSSSEAMDDDMKFHDSEAGLDEEDIKLPYSEAVIDHDFAPPSSDAVDHDLLEAIKQSLDEAASLHHMEAEVASIHESLRKGSDAGSLSHHSHRLGSDAASAASLHRSRSHRMDNSDNDIRVLHDFCEEEEDRSYV